MGRTPGGGGLEGGETPLQGQKILKFFEIHPPRRRVFRRFLKEVYVQRTGPYVRVSVWACVRLSAAAFSRLLFIIRAEYQEGSMEALVT